MAFSFESFSFNIKLGYSLYTSYSGSVIIKLNDILQLNISYSSSVNFNSSSSFCEKVEEEVPNNQYKPKRDELIRMVQRSFRRPVKLWSEDDAPVTGKRFYDYQSIGYKIYDMLGINR